MKITITADGLAAGLNINKQTLAKHRAEIRKCPLLEGLPDPYVTRPRLLWWVADIEAWSESRRTFRPIEKTEAIPMAATAAVPHTPPKRRRGRPTNAEKYGEAK